MCYGKFKTIVLPTFAVVVAILAGLAPPIQAQVLVEAWGHNAFGELGNGTTTTSASPVVVSMLSPSIVIGGRYHSLAIQNGAVYAWGLDDYGETGNGATQTAYSTPVPSNLTSGVTAIAAGGYHSLAIQNGAVYSWGYNYYGDVGNGTVSRNSPNYGIPTPVQVISSGVTAIAAGDIFCLALKNGGVYSWGSNQFNELGNGTSNNSYVPIAASVLTSGVSTIAAGVTHGLAIKNGAVYAWGQNDRGELGNGTTNYSNVPTPVSILTSGVTAIAGGNYFSVALQNHHVYAWGNDSNGELGDGATTDQLTPELIDPTDLNNIVAISVNSDGLSTYALASDGTIWDWGVNSNGELGLGNFNSQYLAPQHLLPPSGFIFTSVAANGSGALATLVPVPEPASAMLLGIGTIVLLCRRSRSI